MEPGQSTLHAHDFFVNQVDLLPMQIVVPVSKQVNRIASLFGSDSEYVLSRIIDAISDYPTSNKKVSRLAEELYTGLRRGPYHAGVAVLDHTITLEQAALDIRDILFSLGCYVNGRWLIYLYETTMPSGDLLLRRPTGFDEFCDEVYCISEMMEIFNQL